MLEFEAWPKIGRLNRTITITEKIDGTNAAIIITPDEVGAQSRNRLITPESDNFGFATWVRDNADALRLALGEGRHFGEWWGSGIQRGYGLLNGEKRFSLFNTSRWTVDTLSQSVADFGLYVVPELYIGSFSGSAIDETLENLAAEGSNAAPGFMDPEGIVVYHHAVRQMFKVTLKGDEQPKGLAA